MLDIKTGNTNIKFSGRNKEIKEAELILHKIKSDFPCSSSFVADLLAQKREIRSEQPNVFISLPDIIERYYNTTNIGAKLTNKHIAALRNVQKHYIDNDYKYCDSLIWGIKNLRVMNCKENSELAFLIAKINGYKSAYCINLVKKLPNSVLVDLEHTVLLINQDLPPNIEKLDKFYNQEVKAHSAFMPSRKSIVIDPLFGIVDYWENAIQTYKSIFPQMSDVKQFWACARDIIIKKVGDIENFKHFHPELIINPDKKVNEPNFFVKIINFLRNLCKQS